MGYNIGYWLWELEEFPKEWLPAFHLLDEVWTPSEFISQNLRKYTDKPVYTLPYSVTAPADAAYDRDYFHLPKDRFLFLMMYDSGSGMVRKNPLGAIEAFKQAFDRGNKQVGLVKAKKILRISAQNLTDMIIYILYAKHCLKRQSTA